jgi:signal transduction histidine kinase
MQVLAPCHAIAAVGRITTMRRILRRAVHEAGQLLIGAGIALPVPLLLVLLAASVPASLAAGAGLALFVGTVLVLRRLAQLQRRRASAVLGRPLTTSYTPLPVGPVRRLGVVITDPATWRDLLWAICHWALGLFGAVLGIGLWATALEAMLAPALNALLPDATSFDPAVLEFTRRDTRLAWLAVLVGAGLAVVAYRLPRHLIAGQARLAGVLLVPGARNQLTARVDELTATRASAVDSSAAELRRLERDLHDGAQMRLVAATMSIGMAADLLERDPANARALLEEARSTTGEALSELRDLVRGIHPPVLADRGVVGAVEALALASPVPVHLDLELPGRLPAAVESAAYFVVAELLTNAIRHSGARRIDVGLHHNIHSGASVLGITVSDDGHGGADPDRGTGLRGVQRRLSSFDGRLRIASPPGGPTTLDIELPCGS